MMKKILFLTFVFITAFVIILPSGNSQTNVVEEGEPLHLWLKRSPTQDLTTLHFYKPLDNEDVRGDARFRHTLGPKGEENDKLVMFFPTDQKSNFLQFEYNETLTGNYSFTISAISMLSERFSLGVELAFDKDRDGKYDESFTFTISGNTSRGIERYKGNINIPSDLIKKFDGKNGGRIRMTISRNDNLDINVLIYCGYRGEFSSLWLPYSKYTYVPQNEEDGPDYTLYVILGIMAVTVFVLVIIFGFRSKDGGKEKTPPQSGRRRRKSKR